MPDSTRKVHRIGDGNTTITRMSKENWNCHDHMAELDRRIAALRQRFDEMKPAIDRLDEQTKPYIRGKRAKG